jgi:preprotein translocase subunit SecA
VDRSRSSAGSAWKRGWPIEDKRISKGILRAQKKVEERNFLARKNLLEYDEVMNHQRTTFYGMRQQVLEGPRRRPGHLEHDRDAIRDAVDKYITQDFVAANVAEWARVNFDVCLDPEDFKGYRRYEDIEPFIKDQARPRRRRRSTRRWPSSPARAPRTRRVGHQGVCSPGR